MHTFNSHLLEEEGLVVRAEGDVRLRASRCNGCAAITFPAQSSCPRCTGADVVDHALARTGTLWTWTVQRFAPKSPPYGLTSAEAFREYAVGYVELPGEVRVETRLVTGALDQLHIGMPMELTLVPVPTHRGEAATFAFRPVGDGS